MSKLPPATVRCLRVRRQQYSDRVYWDPPFTRHPERAKWTEQDWQDALLESLTTAVRRRMVADVPVGVLLSGGLDSSLLVALLAEAGQRDLATFSIGFDAVGGRDGDEFAYSDLVAKTFDTDHHKIKVASADLVEPLQAAVAAMSEPMVSHDCVAFYLLSQVVSRAPEGGPVRPGGGRDSRRLPLVSAVEPGRAGRRRSTRTRGRSSTGTLTGWPRCSTPPT